MWRVMVCLGVCLLAAACGGSSSSGSPVVAKVSGRSISQAQVTAYREYAASFYRLALGGSQLGGFDCAGGGNSCATSADALRRLIQEAVIESYAAKHGIALTAADRRAAKQEVQALSSSDPTAGQLLTAHKVSTSFLTRLLETEMLVRKVEGSVVGNRAYGGRSYHLKIFSIPLLSKKTYKQALELAGFGSPVPVGTSIRREWIAGFRLPLYMKKAAKAALPGDFIGPFKRPGRYVVAKVIAKERRRFGKPARQARETQLFQAWVAGQVQRARPTCYAAKGRVSACP